MKKEIDPSEKWAFPMPHNLQVEYVNETFTFVSSLLLVLLYFYNDTKVNKIQKQCNEGM